MGNILQFLFLFSYDFIFSSLALYFGNYSMRAVMSVSFFSLCLVPLTRSYFCK